MNNDWENSVCFGCLQSGCYGDCEEYAQRIREQCYGAVAMEQKEALGLNPHAVLGEVEKPERISWEDYFLGLAHTVSRRSIDGQTKHGCLLVDSHKHIIGVGYNSHGTGLPASLPRMRPEKYPWMIHSEENAIINCTISPWMIPGGLTAYITGHPCFRCAYLLRQATIKSVVFSGTKRWLEPVAEDKPHFERLLNDDKAFTITRHKPDLNWLYDDQYLSELWEMGYID